MRRLVVLVLACAVLWSGYWFVSAAAMRQGLQSWFEDRRAEGWVAEASELGVAGYPNRIDTTFTEITLADPETGLVWEAPFFQLFALSYRPNHIIAVWPNEQTVATPYDKFELTSTDMRASLEVQPSSALEINRLVLTAEDLVIRRDRQLETAELTALTLAAERVEETAEYRLGLKADGFKPALPFKVQVDPADALPDRLQALNADFSVVFSQPWDQSAIEEARPQPQEIRITLAEAKWGQLELQLAGAVQVDEAGVPNGEMTLRARNWREILELGSNSGYLPEILAGTLEEGLDLLSQVAGNPKMLDLPLNFTNGKVFLGPIPLGPAPVLTIR